jgi:exodeoxyribonuclease VIII
MIEPGMYPHLSNEDYHSDSAISRSGIMTYLDSPYKYWAHYINTNREKKEVTQSMILGSAFHTFVLEPDKFYRQYVIEPEKVLLKNVGREAYEDYKLKLEIMKTDRRILISNSEWDLLCIMHQALEKHSEAWDLIQGAQYEQSYFWQDKESGLMVKCRPDILHNNIIVDLKTIASASSRYYQRRMYESGYHIQGAMIREGIRETTGKDIPNVINVCIEKVYPFEIGIKIISEKALDEGRRKFKAVSLDINHSIVNNTWESYQPETVDLPGWV